MGKVKYAINQLQVYTYVHIYSVKYVFKMIKNYEDRYEDLVLYKMTANSFFFL